MKQKLKLKIVENPTEPRNLGIEFTTYLMAGSSFVVVEATGVDENITKKRMQKLLQIQFVRNGW